ELLEDGCSSWEREALAIFIASALIAEDEREEAPAPPPKLIERARFLSRHQLGAEGGLLLGGAAIRLRDPHLTALATPHMNRAKRSKRVLDERLDQVRGKPLESLDDVAGSRISTGFTVKREAPAIGRNDPCPC